MDDKNEVPVDGIGDIMGVVGGTYSAELEVTVDGMGDIMGMGGGT